MLVLAAQACIAHVTPLSNHIPYGLVCRYYMLLIQYEVQFFVITHGQAVVVMIVWAQLSCDHDCDHDSSPIACFFRNKSKIFIKRAKS